MKSPLVSVIIPTYNRANLLITISVNSVLKQKYQNWELLIVDDGSTDNTKELVLKLIEDNPDKNIRYYYQENKGQGAARNLGIKQSKGPLVLLLDSDDAILPDMIKVMITKIKPSIDYIACKRWVFHHRKGYIDVNHPNPSCSICKKTCFMILAISTKVIFLEGWRTATC